MAENSATNAESGMVIIDRSSANSYNDEAAEGDEGDLSWSETDVSLEGTWTDEEREPREKLTDGGCDVEEEMTTDERGKGRGKERTDAVRKQKEGNGEKNEKDTKEELEDGDAPIFDRTLAKITFSRRSASSVCKRVASIIMLKICGLGRSAM